MTSIPAHAQVVVVGGGIAGCSVGHHLGALGVPNVLVLERSTLSSGTTWHSTGNMETYRSDPLVYEMVRYAADLYPRLAADCGRDIGWRSVGRVMYTDREERWASFQTLPELGRTRGIEIAVLNSAEVGRRLPIISTDGLLGGVWIPSDARVNATDAVMALAASARKHGVTICQNASVTEIDVRRGAVCGVVTADGTVECDKVVVAAELWSDEIAASCGLRLPLHALEHQYLITKPIGIDRDMPLFLSYDDQLYGREEVGGIMVGSLDDHAIPLSADQLPQNFSFALLDERWEQFEPYMAIILRRFPVLRDAPIRMLLNGPESFTPDGQMLLGPVPGVTGLYAACAFNSNGIALAPAAGRYIAEWIVEGAPSADVAPLDVRRFSALQATREYVRDRVTEIPGYHCRMHQIDSDYETARDIRRSPLHHELANCEARFASVNGWERPLWIPDETGATGLLEAVAAEAVASRESVLLVDRSSDTKCLVQYGASTAKSGDKSALWPVAAGRALLTPLQGGYGQIEALARVLSWSIDTALVIASPDQEARLQEWLRLRAPDSMVIDVTAAHAILELAGPKRRQLIAGLSLRPTADQADCTTSLGAVPLRIFEDPAFDSTLLLVPCDGASYVWRKLLASGTAVGLRVGGHFAQEAHRIDRGIPAFGREATPNRLATELGGGFARASDGRRPAAAVPATHRPRRLAAFSIPIPASGFGGREVILQDGRAVGELTSRVRLPGWPVALALGLIDATRWRYDAAEVVADGRRWPLLPRTTAWAASS